MSLVLNVFGAVQAIWEGVPLKFATEHVRALLVYLAVEADVVHPRTTLATLLWPEESETRARHNLRQALFFLKQAFRAYGELDTLLYITPTALQWKNQAIEVDFHAFQRSWKYSQSHGHANLQRCATCLEHFSRALALYQGEFLQGLSLKENQPFEEWALLLREQCHRQAMAMLGSLVAHHLDAGAYEQAAHHATRQVTLEPWYEEGHRHLMQAMAAQGQKSAALRQYEHCRHLLQQELGVPPASETTKLYDQIRTGQFDHLIRSPSHLITPSPLHNIPGTLPPLVGRSQHLEQLRSLLSNPTQRLLTITGMGGMGKSRLALGLLEQLVGESPALFAHGVWFVPTVAISPTVENLTDGLVGAAFKALGVVTPNQAVLSNALFQYLAQRQLLLVFDSFEHLLVEERAATAATEFILALLQAAPDVKVIVTSRQPLQLLVETVIRLEGLLIPSASTPKLDKRDAVNYESIRLFLYHVQRILPRFALRDDNLQAMIELCHALGGMPLAIELAAALTPHFTLAELVVALRHNLDLLVSQRRDLDARHRHFGAVLESSWQLLSPREQAILAQSSVFVGRFSRVAAQTVTGATVSELAGLVDKSLIQQPGVGVYQLHDLLRQFAADKLHASAQETFAVAERHSAFYLNFVAERERMLTRDQPRQAVEEIQQEVDNVRQACAWAITQLVRLASQLPAAEKITATLDACAYALWNFYLIAGLYAEGVAAFQQASAGVQSILNGLSASLATAEGTEVPVRRWQQLLSKLLALGAYIQCTFGSYSDALTTAKQSIAVGVAYGGHAGELIGLLAIALSHYHTGASKEAQTYCTQALQRLQQFAWVNKPPEFYYDVQFVAHLYLGVIAVRDDDYTQAQSHIRQALELCQPLGKVRGEMHARLNLANLARYKQDYAAAEQEYQLALQIACDLGYLQGEAMARYELADVLRGLGKYTPALDQFALAISILREIGDPFHRNYADVDIGRVYAYLGDGERARDLIHQALRRSEHITMLDAKLDVLLGAALLHQLAGEESEALSYATHCHQIAHEHGNRSYEGRALLDMGNALAGLGRWHEANAAYADALAIYQQLDIQPTVAEAVAGMARTALAQGDLASALTWVEKVLTILEDASTIGLDEPFQIYLTCYQVLAANQDERATLLLHRGYNLLQQYAGHIQDHTLRRSFLENVVVHRELKQMFEHGTSQGVPNHKS